MTSGDENGGAPGETGPLDETSPLEETGNAADETGSH